MAAAPESVILTASSPRWQLEERLLELSAAAKRIPHWDHLSRPHEDWAAIHGFIDQLLSWWEQQAPRGTA